MKTASHHHHVGQHLMHALLEKQAGKGDAFERIGRATEYLTQRLAKGDGNPAYLRRMAKKLQKIEERGGARLHAARDADRVRFPIAGPQKGYSREAMQGANPMAPRKFQTKGGEPMNREQILRTLRNDAHAVHLPDGSSYTLDGRGHMVFHGPKGDIQVAGRGTNRAGVPALPASQKEQMRLMRDIDKSHNPFTNLRVDRQGKVQEGWRGSSPGEWTYTPRGGVTATSKKYYPEASGSMRRPIAKKRGKYEQRRR